VLTIDLGCKEKKIIQSSNYEISLIYFEPFHAKKAFPHTGTEHGIGCSAKTLPSNMNFQKLAIFLKILQIYEHTHIH
jgi:hypothetical protein